MSEQQQESSEDEVFRMVFVRKDGSEHSTLMLLNPYTLAAMKGIGERLVRDGAFSEVRFDAAPGEIPFPTKPKDWAGYEPLEYDNELPPLDRPKIR